MLYVAWSRVSVFMHTGEMCKDEPIEMMFEGLTNMDQRNRVLDGGPDPPRERALLTGTCTGPW